MTENQIISRAEAKALGLKRYFTGKPCKHGHVAERRVSSRECCECGRLKYQTPESKAYHAAYRKEHAEHRKAYEAAYREEHAAHYKALGAAYCQSDKWKEYQRSEGRRAAGRVYAHKRRTSHPDEVNTYRIKDKYPAAIVPLTEAEQSRLRWFYITARELSKRTGRKYEVDHCFPLALGGLHHPLNLMILPTWANRKKSSKYLPDNPLAVRGLQLKDRLSLRITIHE